MTRDNKIIMFALFFWGIGEGTWFFIRSLYLEELGARPEEVGLALSIAALTIAASFLPGGWLADRFDRKHVLVAGWLAGVFAPALMALADNWREFMVGYTVYNLSAFVLPAIDAYVAHAAGRAPLGRVFPIVYAGYAIGSVLGPQLSKALLAILDVRGVLFLSSALFGMSTLAVAFVRRQPVTPPAAQAGARLSPIAALRPALIFFAILFVIEFGMSIGAQLIPNYLQRIGWQLADVSGIGSAQPIGVACLSLLVGHLSAGREQRGLLIAQALVLASMVVFAFGAWAWGGFVGTGYFMLGGYQAARQQANARVSRYVRSEHRGMAFAVTETIAALSLAAAAMAGGLLFASNPVWPFYAGLLLIPIGALLTLRLRGPRHAQPADTRVASVDIPPADVMREASHGDASR